MEKLVLFSTQPEVLSVENIAKVRNRLASLEVLSPALESCLDYALLKFSREERCLQENASLDIHCEERQLQFLSGNGESHLEVTFVQGNPDYKVQLPRFSGAVERSPCGRLLLSVQNLEKIAAEMVTWREMTKGLKACLDHAQVRFSREPFRIQENCTMLIQQGGRTLELTTGEGENCITVCQAPDRTVHYNIEPSTVMNCFVRALTPSVW